MAEQKTNRDLDIRRQDLEKAIDLSISGKGAIASVLRGSKDALKQMKEWTEAIELNIEKEEERVKYYKALRKYVEENAADEQKSLKYLSLKLRDTEKLLETQEKIVKSSEKALNTDKKITNQNTLLNAVRKDANRILSKTIRNNQEIFKIGREMQLQSNATWKEYTKLYEKAFEGSRKVNAEIKQSIFNVKDLVNTQNRLMGSGWKDIDPKTLTNVSSSVMQMSKTLGELDARLVKGLEGSYRLFGDQTDSFINQLGNQLNEYSKTFGVQTQQLQKVVVDLMRSNNFINRSNIEANMRANQSLIKAAALAHNVGLVSNDFIGKLATTSQYGTMEQMASIYQGGALLQGFNTQKFQQDMIGQNYETATRDLLKSIYGTLNNIDDHYLRAEYMQQIGGTFGFSQDELLAIMTHGNKIGEYSQELQEKLAGVNTSMKDELTDLRVNMVDRIENAVQNHWASEGMGRIMQKFGLYGLTDPVRRILFWVRTIGLKDGKLMGMMKAFTGIGLGGNNKVSGGILQKGIPKIGSNGSSTIIPQSNTGSGVSIAPGLAMAGGGLLAYGGNKWGRNVQSNTNLSDPVANIAGGALNIGSGALGGALIGSAIPVVGTALGAGIGALVGGINTLVGANQRKSKLEELDKADRQRRQTNARSTFVDYGYDISRDEAIVEAINQQTSALVNIISGNHEENKTFILLGETYSKTTTLSEV
jgi:hypothetical protein